jgi:hypothetical protein
MPDNYGYRHTPRIRNNYFTWQQWLRERASMLRLYVYWPYLFSFIKPTTYTCFGTDIICHPHGVLVPRLNPTTNGFNRLAVSLLIWRCAFGWFNKAIHWSEMHGMDRFKITLPVLSNLISSLECGPHSSPALFAHNDTPAVALGLLHWRQQPQALYRYGAGQAATDVISLQNPRSPSGLLRPKSHGKQLGVRCRGGVWTPTSSKPLNWQ